ncbi:MAG: hypothetical protein RR958_19705, partial [Pseudomonas sp.]
ALQLDRQIDGGAPSAQGPRIQVKINLLFASSSVPVQFEITEQTRTLLEAVSASKPEWLLRAKGP